MAISEQDKCSAWKTKQLPFKIVMFLLEQITSFVHSATNTREDKSHKQQQQQRWWLKVRIDANLLGYKYIHDQSSSFEPNVAIKCIAWAFFVHWMMGVRATSWCACSACMDEKFLLHVVCKGLLVESYPSHQQWCSQVCWAVHDQTWTSRTHLWVSFEVVQFMGHHHVERWQMRIQQQHLMDEEIRQTE